MNKFTGGKISVRHGDQTWSIDPAKSKSTVRCSWIAFKADAEFQVEAVSGGTTQALLVYHILGDKKKGNRWNPYSASGLLQFHEFVSVSVGYSAISPELLSPLILKPGVSERVTQRQTGRPGRSPICD